MSSIHSKDTKPEIILRDALHAQGFNFETNYGSEKIDIAFTEKKIAVFVDGCFWHVCPMHSHKIGTNEPYWKAKLEKNQLRDKAKTKELESEGWMVIRFWEHELTEVDKLVMKIKKSLETRTSIRINQLRR